MRQMGAVVRSEVSQSVNSRCSITRKTAPPPLAAIFHDDWAKNVTSRVFTSFFLLYKYKKNCSPPPNSHVIQLTGTIFQHNSRIKETNARNVTSRVFTCFHFIHIEKNAPPTGSHVFSPIWTIFELVQHINKTNVLTNFHDNWANIVTSRVFTRKTAPPTGGNVFQRNGLEPL
ncbi:hypothetical protein DPMN_106689 [Dreissena polymorpha]|uniref:Uncharacterized protein n=1 Tax=Dreissena polymorpha TaxID=45954 RepID=A0A9D4K5N9_DREPO|nr:hypothetical protein DPMN_106689 [Dreissena polymorpha]